MKKSIVLICLFYLTVSAQAQQNKMGKNVIEKKDSTQLFEKVYLHTDRNYYFSGDDIWFKAYLVDAFSNVPINTSRILYVELINPKGIILQKRTIRINSGLARGDFHLKDSIAAGQYQIRAYTNWMRNFDDVFFFKKEIYIQNILTLKNKLSDYQNKESKVDLQFFPEGGSLIEDVNSQVAFKAINENGRGCNISGKLVSSDGDTVLNFNSTHLGMGKFFFTPKKGLNYFVIANSDQVKDMKIDLPKPLKTGFVMRVSENLDKALLINLSSNDTTKKLFADQNLKYEILSTDQISIKAIVKLKSALGTNSISFDKYWEGLLKVIIYDSNDLPLCERLFYHHNIATLNIDLSVDKPVYSPWSAVLLDINVKDTSGKTVKAALSCSVVDKKAIKNSNDNFVNIASWLLLESEIKGNIEESGYYFNPKNKDRNEKLDLLLLTQGWRDYKWKHINNKSFTCKYNLEKGFTVSGNLRRLLVNRPIVGATINIGLLDSLSQFFTVVLTDPAGKFKLTGLSFMGEKQLLVSSFDEKHNPRGLIEVDTNVCISPKVDYRSYIPNTMQPKIFTDLKAEADYKFMIKNKYHLNDIIMLKDVEIKENRIENTNSDGNTRLYGFADDVIKVSEESGSATDIFQLLSGRVAGLQVINGAPPSIKIRGARNSPLFLLDGMEVQIDDLSSIPVAEIDKIEVLKSSGNTGIFGSRGGNGVISIFTKQGNGKELRPSKLNNSQNLKIAGYNQERVFYSPKYITKESRIDKPDLRTTLYWVPDIIIGYGETPKIEFYNSGNPTQIEIRVEGITENGIPISASTTYDIKPIEK